MTLHIESEQLGPLEIPKDSVVDFPAGLPGFPQAQQFCLVEVKEGSRFKLLQCTQKAELAFIITDPVTLIPDYPLNKIQQMAGPVGIEPDEPFAVAVIVTVPSPSTPPTANMMAPVAMGLVTRLGTQVILHDYPYMVRHPM